MAVVQAPGQGVARQPLQAIGEQNAGYAQQQPSPYEDIPILVHANEQKALKSEDVIYVRRVEASYGNVHSIFMVCDGHQGAAAANHCVEHLPGLLGQLLPASLPDWRDTRDVVDYAETVRRAISTAAVLLDNDWTRLCEMSGGVGVQDTAGTTLTLAVVSGWLLTVANTGDSNAIIDTGDSVQEITHSHRIQVNKSEQNRLRQAGVQLAPLGFHLQGPAKPQEMGVGPLRMWPGGLCVSRSIGDLDAGPLIVPLPHVRQVVLTRYRALRLVMASDGLWDLMSFSKAAKSVRHKLPHQAVSTLVQMVARDKRMADDVSVIILDMLPPPAPGIMPQQFPASALKAASGKGSSSSNGSYGRSDSSSGRSTKSGGGGGGLFACFKSSPVQEDDANVGDTCAAMPHNAQALTGPLAQPWTGLTFLADVDCYQTYPVHGQQLARVSVPAARRPSPPPKQKGDYTVHGGHAHRFQQDSSWHAGNSQHGASNLPMFLSQAQLEQLQAKGPAAAAGMVLHPTGYTKQDNSGAYSASIQSGAAAGSPYEGLPHGSVEAGGPAMGVSAMLGGSGGAAAISEHEQVLLMMGSGALDSMAAAASIALAGAGGSEGRVRRGNQVQPQRGAADANNKVSNSSAVLMPSGLNNRPSHLLPTDAYDAASGAASSGGAAAGPTGARSLSYQAAGMQPQRGQMSGSGASSSVRPCSPAPSALMRSASAEFENPDGSGVYVAPDERPVQGKMAVPGRVVGVLTAGPSLPSHFGSAPLVAHAPRRGGVQSPGSLSAAAVAADAEEEEGLRMIGVQSALMTGAYHHHGGGI